MSCSLLCHNNFCEFSVACLNICHECSGSGCGVVLRDISTLCYSKIRVQKKITIIYCFSNIVMIFVIFRKLYLLLYKKYFLFLGVSPVILKSRYKPVIIPTFSFICYSTSCFSDTRLIIVLIIIDGVNFNILDFYFL